MTSWDKIVNGSVLLIAVPKEEWTHLQCKPQVPGMPHRVLGPHFVWCSVRLCIPGVFPLWVSAHDFQMVHVQIEPAFPWVAEMQMGRNSPRILLCGPSDEAWQGTCKDTSVQCVLLCLAPSNLLNRIWHRRSAWHWPQFSFLFSSPRSPRCGDLPEAS